MNKQFHHDSILFDRLVDGELSVAERHELLASLDKRPEGWRRCALAFLEAQSWKTDFLAIVEKSAISAGNENLIAPTSKSPRTRLRTAAQWIAVAAGLLIAFKFGAIQNQREMPVANSPAISSETVVTAPQRLNPENGAKPGDALNLWVRDESGQLRRVRVPLVDANALDDELGLQFQTGVPNDMRDRLEDNGYAVQSKRRYAPLWLDNGRPMIVPVEDTRIVPVSNKVY